MMTRFRDETPSTSKLASNSNEANVVAIVVGVLWIVVVAIGGMVVGLMSKLTGSKAIKTKSGSNYYDIVKPSIAPAPVVFSILWTILFLLFGAAGVGIVLPWLTGEKVDKEKTVTMSLAIVLYLVVLGLLYSWMPIFANRQQPKEAAYILVATLVLYVPMMFLAGSCNIWSLVMLAPLFGWLIVAMIMNSESVAKWNAYWQQTKVNSVKEKLASVGGVSGRSVMAPAPMMPAGSV